MKVDSRDSSQAALMVVLTVYETVAWKASETVFELELG